MIELGIVEILGSQCVCVCVGGWAGVMSPRLEVSTRGIIPKQAMLFASKDQGLFKDLL